MVDQLTLQPFFDSLGQPTAPHAPSVNAAATEKMERVLRSPVDAPGRGILLRAPRAGFGKTHLLSHVQQRLGTTHEFLPLNPLDGSRTDAPAAIEAALRRLTRQLPAGGGLTALDLQARRIFSLALQPLVSSGEVPCQDREAALSALRQRPVETFDFHHSQAVTAHWTKENFEVLGPRLALELSRRTGTSLNESSFWLASLFRFAIAVPEHPGRTGMIIQSATSDAGVERYAALLALLSLIGRVVVAADDLEGMHADPSAALRFASFLASARQDAPRVDVIVSLNDDIWESAFQPALSGGLQDRLGELEIRLEPLDQAGTVALLESRMPGRAASISHRLGLSSGEFYARRVLRKAAQVEEETESSPVRLLADPAATAIPVEAPRQAAAAEPTPVLVPTEPAATNNHGSEPPSRRWNAAASFGSPFDDDLDGPAPGAEAADGDVAAAVAATPEPVPVLAPEPEPEPVATAVAEPVVEAEPEPAFQEVPAPAPATPEPIAVAAAEEAPLRPESPFMVAEPEEATPPPVPASATVAPPAPEGPKHPGSPWPLSDPEPEPAAENPEPVAAAPAGGDRIDDLLRQFRERYGRE